MENIGIKKQRWAINISLGLLTFAVILICSIMWGVYQANYDEKYLIENGIEVEAVGVDWGLIRNSGEHDYSYYCRYEYEDDNGTIYSVKQRFSTATDAQAQICKKITIVIDPNSHYAYRTRLDKLKVNFKEDLILAIIFSIPVPIALYLFIYRSVYRSIMNYKMRKRVGEKVKDFINARDYNKNSITEGEVTKTFKWIVGYVKVKYRDENEETQEKWARSWFTRKEAKFLEQKKIVNIVPYKNTYGILEEMPIERKQKKDELQ